MDKTIQEKGDELVNRFIESVGLFQQEAEECAIIAVEEIINTLNKLLNKSGYVAEGSRITDELIEQTKVLSYLKSKQ